MFRVRGEAGLLLFLLLRFDAVLSGCPKSCVCSTPRKGNKIIANCKDRGFKDIMAPQYLVNVSTLDLSVNQISSLPYKAFGRQKTLKKLILSHNEISTIRNGAFSGLSRLAKLDLENNKLVVLNGEAFKGLRALKSLDLSHNNVNYINGTVFNGLKKLRRLDLSSNKFIIISDATLKPLESLKHLDLSSNDLMCDCHVKWLIKLSKNGVSVKGTCKYPEPLEYSKITELSPRSLQCDTLQLPFYLFKPKNNEVGIKGDSFTFTCGTTWLPGLTINWYKNDKLLIPNSTVLRGDITFNPDYKAARLTSQLTFPKLDLQDTGVYKCVVSSDKTSKEGKSSLLVLLGGSKYCHAETTKTKKGTFHWDNVAVGSIAQLPCPAGAMRAASKGKGVASRKCSAAGKWMEIQADDCSFIDGLTQQLYDLKQSPLNSTTAITICKALLRITKNTTLFWSDIDVTYAAEILDRIRPYLTDKQQIGETVVHIVSNLMNAKDTALAEAQKKFKACSSLVMILEEVADTRTTLVTNNVAMSTDIMYPAAYKGKTCAALRNDKGHLDTISCDLFQNASTFSPSKLLQASVHLPKDLFVGRVFPPTTEVKLRFIVYKNSKLFPRVINGSLVDDPKVVTSVVHLRIGTPLFNLTQPVAMKYQMDQKRFSSPISAYWKPTQQAGIGAWLENKDCVLSKESNNTITHCTRLIDKTYFAILMSVDRGAKAARGTEHNGFMLEPLVYVGAAVCVLLLLMTFITYAIFRKLRYNRDDAAMLMNLCLALLVAVVVFVAGIYHVTNTLVCRAVGVLLHYFLLCSLLWIGCGGLCLCRRIRTAITPEEFNPVLRYYMISWGIPLIICGITVAGNPDNYGVDTYCWLKPNPFLGAFVGPACLVVLIDIIMFIRLNNLALKTYDNLAYEKHVFQMEPEETVVAGEEENLPEQIASKCELIQQIEEALPPREEIFVYQKGSLLVLLMILVNFALGFLLIRFQHSRYLNVALSCAYTVANITLGLIIFLFHCYKNKRAKQYWVDLCKKFCRRKKYVLDQEGEEHQDIVTNALVNGDAVREHDTPVSVIPQINRASATPVPSDIQSNVSLSLSAPLVVDIPINSPRTVQNGGPIPITSPASPPGSDKHSITTSMSDKQSCVSAPLPLSHTPQNITQHPPNYRYSYCVSEMEDKKKKGKKKKERIPLAIPEKNLITSSRESSMKLKNEENSSRKPSQNSLCDQAKKNVEPEAGVPETALSELSSHGPGSYLEAPFNPYSSCASSGVSVPAACDLQPRPPVPGAQDLIPIWPGGNQYPYGPGNISYFGNVPMQGPCAKNISEERYVTIPQRPNGVVRQRPPEHVYESINDPPPNAPNNTENTHPSREQNGPNRPDNEIPYTENNPLLPPPRGNHLNGPSSDNHPRKRSRRNSDKSRTRRSREGNSQSKRRQTSSLPPHRTSVSSLKPERVKPEPKEWIADPVPRLSYVPVPHLSSSTSEARNETSV